MRVFVNTELQLLTDIGFVSQAIQDLRIPRAANVPLVVQFTRNGTVYEPDAPDVTVANQAARYRLGEIAAAITSSSVANPTVITATGHGLLTGDTVTIAGHSGSTPDINSEYAVTKLTDDTFSIPIEVTVGGTGGTATKAAATKNQLVLQSDTGVLWKVIDEDELDNPDGYQDVSMTIRWIVKEDEKFDGDALVLQTAFTKSGSDTAAKYTMYLNYVTAEIDDLLAINPPTTSDDKPEVITMAQLDWSGPESGKTHWIKHTIRNVLDRDGDETPVTSVKQSDKTAIPSGQDYVDVVFDTPYANDNWHFIGAPVISNVDDVSPLGIFIVGFYERSSTGFTIALSADVDSANYKIEWTVTPD